MVKNYFSKYEKTNQQGLDIFQALMVVLSKTQKNIRHARDALQRFDDLARVQACSDAAFNLSLVVDALNSGVFQEDACFNSLKRSCVLFVELLSRANIQKSIELFERIDHELGAFKRHWGAVLSASTLSTNQEISAQNGVGMCI